MSIIILLLFLVLYLLFSEVVEKFPALRNTITSKLIATLPEVKSGKVFRGVLWILGEYVENISDIQGVMREVRKVLGEIPILASEQRLLDDSPEEGTEGGEEKEKEKAKVEGGGRPRVLADGTYATETAYTSTSSAKLEAVKAAAKPPLRTLILAGDFFTGTVLVTALTKLVLRFAEQSQNVGASNMLRAEVCLFCFGIREKELTCHA
jgi:coatomer subunit beta